MVRLLCLALLLAACNTPSPEFRAVAATRVVAGGMVFDVRVQNGKAEAMRLNRVPPSKLRAVFAPAQRAMEAVSGCRVTKLSGDPALMFGKLDCPGGAARKRSETLEAELDCVELSRWTSEGLAQETTLYDCVLLPE